MYAKLIFKNAKRSVKDYLIYIVTMTLCVTLFYAFLSISSTHYHPTIGAEYNISLLAGGMKLAICGISLLLLFLIHYVNRFMLRKKQSEFVERFPELSLFFKAYSLLDSEMICIFPYLCPYAESAREIREIFS